MTADIFYPIFTLTITVLACFIQKNKPVWAFALTPLPEHHPGPLGRLTAPPRPPTAIVFDFAKTDVPIFFLYFPQLDCDILYLQVAFLSPTI